MHLLGISVSPGRDTLCQVCKLALWHHHKGPVCSHSCSGSCGRKQDYRRFPRAAQRAKRSPDAAHPVLISCPSLYSFSVQRPEGTGPQCQAALGLEAALLRARWSPSLSGKLLLHLVTLLPVGTL